MNISRYGKGLFGAMVIAIVMVLAASDGDARPRRAGYCAGGPGIYHLNRMQERLNLTDAQVQKIFSIETQYREKSFQNRKNPDKLRSLSDESRKEIEKVLTPEQKKKYSTRRKGNDGPPRERRNRAGK